MLLKQKIKNKIISFITAGMLCVTPLNYYANPPNIYEIPTNHFVIPCDSEINSFLDISPKEMIKMTEKKKEQEKESKRKYKETIKRVIMQHKMQQQILIEKEILIQERKKESHKIKEKPNSNKYKITAYCACVKCCGKSDGITASGAKAKQGVTIATGKLKFGTKVYIDGVGERVVQDRGVNAKTIDVYFTSHSEALKFGTKYKEVTILT